MPQIINTNISSLTAQRNSNRTQNELSTAIQRLSSGLRINSAKDDAAGLAISDRMTSQIRGISQAARNANDGISLAQVAEGALSSASGNLQRMRELAVQSANATNSASDRAALQQEVAQLATEIDRVATQTQFNGLNLLDGTFIAQQFQVGANAGQTITVSAIANSRSSVLGKYNGFQLTAQSIGAASNTAVLKSVTVGGTSYPLGTIANDAKALATAFNGAGIPGMTVTANAAIQPAAVQTLTGAATLGSVTLTVGSTPITFANANNAGTNRTTAVTAINAQSAVTGVVAADTGSGISLTAADGRNITTAFTDTGGTGTGVADFGLGAVGSVGGTLNMTYQAPPGVGGTVTFTGAFNPGAQTIASTGTSIAALDISTLVGATAALLAVDSALGDISSSRAALGAVQNRFSSTIENLQTTGENLSASRSRIQDADFAAETAALSRAQVLQQAGTAMVAQANALPNQVLQLLKG